MALIFHTIRLEKDENFERYLVECVQREVANMTTPNLEDSIVHVSLLWRSGGACVVALSRELCWQ